jgi:ribosomal protein S18 acetylase RimI-like enzyme
MFIDLNSLFQFNKDNIHLASKVAAQAYFEKDNIHNLITDPTKKLHFLTKLMDFTFRYSFKYGEVFATSSDLEGVVAWLPHDKVFISSLQYIRYGALSAVLKGGRGYLKKMRLYSSLCQEMHKKHANFPHWYLYNLAIIPKHQGKSFATRLLKPKLAILDKLRLPCFLETSDRNITLYQHFGFEVVERVSLPKLEEDVWFMLRNFI